MKNIITAIAVCLFAFKGFSQFVIEEEFNSGTAPSGWTFTSIGSNSTLSNCGKSANALDFNATGDQIISPAFSGGDQLTFIMISNGSPNNTDLMQVEALNGSWSTIANLRPHTTSVVYCVNIASGVTQLRLTFTKGAVSHVYLDDFTVRQAGQCTAASNQPYITAINANACGTGCEGHDEFFTIKNGNSTLNISDLEISYPNAGTSPSTWCGTSTTPCDKFLVTNSTEVAALNALAGCSIFFSASSIPANASIMLFNGNPQQTRTNFSGICGSGKTYYAVFANNTNTSTSDGCNGRFGNDNSCSGLACYRGLFIRDRANGCDDTVSYSVGSINGNDGAMALYATRNSLVSYTNGANSTCGFIALPLKIVSFYVQVNAMINTLSWDTEEDESVVRYDVEKSADGSGFYKIGEVLSKTGHEKSEYSYVDNSESLLLSYYRLKSIDNSGNETYSQIIDASNPQSNQVIVTQDENTVYIKAGGREGEVRTLTVYNSMGGKMLDEAFTGTSFSFPKGSMKGQLCYVLLNTNGSNITKRLFAE